MSKILRMTLKRRWYDMILSGEKPEEYREIKLYWAIRLLQVDDMIYGRNVWEEPAIVREMLDDLKNPTLRHNSLAELLGFYNVRFKTFDAVGFTNGYSRSAPSFDIGCNGTTVATGKEQWGAEPDKNYFVIQLGDVFAFPQ